MAKGKLPAFLEKGKADRSSDKKAPMREGTTKELARDKKLMKKGK